MTGRNCAAVAERTRASDSQKQRGLGQGTNEGANERDKKLDLVLATGSGLLGCFSQPTGLKSWSWQRRQSTHFSSAKRGWLCRHHPGLVSCSVYFSGRCGCACGSTYLAAWEEEDKAAGYPGHGADALQPNNRMSACRNPLKRMKRRGDAPPDVWSLSVRYVGGLEAHSLRASRWLILVRTHFASLTLVPASRSTLPRQGCLQCWSAFPLSPSFALSQWRSRGRSAWGGSGVAFWAPIFPPP